MRQKLKFAQAIVHDPSFLILDEPTSGLDPEEREALLKRVRLLAERAGKSILISTHILPDVQAICDTVVILAHGRVRVVDRLDVLVQPTSPSFRIGVVDGAERLADRIRQEGGAVDLDQNNTLTVQDADGRVGERVWHLAREEGVSVRMLSPAQNSLEEIFLDAVREDRHADS